MCSVRNDARPENLHAVMPSSQKTKSSRSIANSKSKLAPERSSGQLGSAWDDPGVTGHTKPSPRLRCRTSLLSLSNAPPITSAPFINDSRLNSNIRDYLLTALLTTLALSSCRLLAVPLSEHYEFPGPTHHRSPCSKRRANTSSPTSTSTPRLILRGCSISNNHNSTTRLSRTPSTSSRMHPWSPNMPKSRQLPLPPSSNTTVALP